MNKQKIKNRGTGKQLVLESYKCILNEEGNLNEMWDFLFKKVIKFRMDKTRPKLSSSSEGLYNIKGG